jgi:uncharacterized BrkB/YihY/UPF0761 family membrane protein
LPDLGGYLIVLLAGAALAAGQAWFFPLGDEKAEPRLHRTWLAVASIVLIVVGLGAAHALLPAHPTLAAALGAVAGVMAMKLVRAAFAASPVDR